MTAGEPGMVDFYKVLGVGPEASLDEIKQAYRRAVFLTHPDTCASAAALSQPLQLKPVSVPAV